MKRAFVTGAAGFIGSNLVDRLLAEGHHVFGWDNFATGNPRFLEQARQYDRFWFEEGCLHDMGALTEAMEGCTEVYHLAANADVRYGVDDPKRDLKANTIATSNVLEAMRANGIKRIIFASSGSVYGEATVIPTPEDVACPVQNSLYGASKMACEGLLQAYASSYGFEPVIYRFVSILGERYSHGHVFDFVKQLLAHPDHLTVLGDGTARKSYLYVGDCVDAIVTTKDCPIYPQVFNLGTEEYVTVRDSIAIICEVMGLEPQINYGTGDRGWIGDSPFIFLDTTKVRQSWGGPKVTIRHGIQRTVGWLLSNVWALGRL